jgi:2-succinyl-6-hydroxy-2,4-cyclohexadiene-1-carboxylate synthase
VSACLVALHGFLGSATDWNSLADRLPGVTLRALDLWKVFAESSAHDWASATAAVDRAIADSGFMTAESPGPVFVVGYSMGARLALGSRLLSSANSPVCGCCFVSCNPGLADGDHGGRAARRESDEAWARAILSESEAALWRAWDAQPVFGGSTPPPTRGALPAPRDVLARALTACSLAGQPDLRVRLREWPVPALWVTGARDARFVAIARQLEQAGAPARFVTCAAAGHRVPWDNPPAFTAALQEWIAR